MIPFNDDTIASIDDWPIGKTAHHFFGDFSVDENTVAVIFSKDGEWADFAENVETSISMVNEGELALAVKPAGHYETTEDFQKALDDEAELRTDCFG